MTTDTRHCRVCGAPFTRSPADTTVNCPEHRRRAPRARVADAPKSVICSCGKTVIVDGFGTPTRNVCPVCGDS